MRLRNHWLWLVLLAVLPGKNLSAEPQPLRPPNVILVITDDQGYGDLGFHGNPVVRTPHLDRLAREAVQFQSFYVSPVCAPTRASLMTGRYNYRTGVTDTYLGRALMHPDEITLAEMLQSAGYRTGIFGKWHLGDNCPMRALDQGFQESLTLNGGGIGQPSDPPGGESYFDPVLYRNGKPVKTKGYVSDVITGEALSFIEKNRARPFFVYLAFNAPHTPLEVPAEKYGFYKRKNLGLSLFPASGHPIGKNYDPDTTARVYGMVENLDDNVGRVMAKLRELGLDKDTIVLFLTDNGPQQPRYNAGLRQLKGTVYEGGIRVPCFMRWKNKLEAGRKVDRIAAHIDLAPTLAEICGVLAANRGKFDGRSLWPLLRGETASWPDRTLFFQWHRGDAPEKWRSFAARAQRFKLVQAKGQGGQLRPPESAFELFDLEQDPLEMKDIAAQSPEVVAKLKQEYEAWFAEVTSQRDYANPPRIFIGSPKENSVRLTRQDWRGTQAGWGPESFGHWEVEVVRGGTYQVAARLPKLARATTLHFVLGDYRDRQEVPAGQERVVFEEVELSPGAGQLACFWEQDGKKIGVRDLEVKAGE